MAKPSQTTTYRVKSQGCGKTVIDTISVKVNPIPQVELGRDTVMCENYKLLLTAAPGYKSYQWQDHSVQNYFEVDKPGTYSVDVTNGFNCTTSDQIKITYDSIPKVDFGQDQVVCDKFPALVAGDDRNVYHWSDGSIYNTMIPRKAGTYWVSASNHCGTGSDTIRLYTPSQMYIPNVVTANGDQINDQLLLGVITSQGTVDKSAHVEASLKLFNRWGQPVFQENDYKGDWPGSSSSVDEGIYYYQANVEGCKEYKGWVQVIK